jgi:hypothetical protein
MLTLHEMDALFEKALEQELGVCVTATNPLKLQRDLFDHKRNNPRYEHLTVAIKKDKTIVIYHQLSGDGLD